MATKRKHPWRHLALATAATTVVTAVIALLVASTPGDATDGARARATAQPATTARTSHVRTTRPHAPPVTRSAAPAIVTAPPAPVALDEPVADDSPAISAPDEGELFEDERRAKTARRALLRGNIESLSAAATEAAANGMSERAALMNQRVDHLQTILAEEFDPELRTDG